MINDDTIPKIVVYCPEYFRNNAYSAEAKTTNPNQSPK